MKGKYVAEGCCPGKEKYAAEGHGAWKGKYVAKGWSARHTYRWPALWQYPCRDTAGLKVTKMTFCQLCSGSGSACVSDIFVVLIHKVSFLCSSYKK